MQQHPEKELIDLEKKYWQALKDKDPKTALQLTDDPCIVTGASGVSSIDHKSFEKMMNMPNYELLDFELKDMKARMIGDDVGVVAYKVKEKLTVEGKPVTLEAADSSTWVRRNGHWVCALHTEAVRGDPFGRDRKAS